MRARDLLHKTKLDDFRAWLEDRGWYQVSCKGEWEVLRMRHPDSVGPLLVYDRLEAREHYTTHGVAYHMACRWVRDRRRQREAVSALTQQAQDWGCYKQENIHNGDPLRPQETRDSEGPPWED